MQKTLAVLFMLFMLGTVLVGATQYLYAKPLGMPCVSNWCLDGQQQCRSVTCWCDFEAQCGTSYPQSCQTWCFQQCINPC